MIISFSPIDEQAASEIVRWCYEPPYEIYNPEDSTESIQYALDPQYNYTTLRDESGRLVGFCSYGADGQVPGGDYSADALDIGMGIHPDFTGQGLGSSYVLAVLDYAQSKFQPTTFRVTIASFNQRARRVWGKNGFRQVQAFTHQNSKREFCLYIKAGNTHTNRHESKH